MLVLAVCIPAGIIASTGAYSSNTHSGEEYVLFGKSMFDKENNLNMYLQGGMPVSYPVWIDFTSPSDVAVDNLIDVRYMNGEAASGTYDQSSGTLTILTPYDFDSSGSLQRIGMTGNNDIILVGGTAYGIGYFDYTEKIVFDVSSDFGRLIPRSGFCGTLIEDGTALSYADIIYDAVLFRKSDGVGFRSDKDEIDMGNGYVGNTYSAVFTLYNVGDESTDYVITPLGSPCITVDNDAGVLSPGEKKETTVLFSPDKTGNFSSELIIESEGETIEVTVTAKAIADEDYAPIVTEGNFRFKMSGLYPWIMDELDGNPVARAANTGISSTVSTLTALVAVDESERGILSFSGLYDPRFSSYDKFYLLVDEEEAYRPTEKGNFDAEIVLGPGEHTLEFVYDKGSFVVAGPGYEYGDDIVYLSKLSLINETVKEFDYTIDKDEVDFGRFFEGSRLFEEGDVQIGISNKGYKTIEITGVSADAPFKVVCDSRSIAPQATGSLVLKVEPCTEGIYESDVTLTTNAGDIIIPCKASVERMPDYSAIVTSGDFTFDTDRNYPFVIDDGKAVNSTSKVTDDEDRLSFFVAYFTVPQGSTGNLRWKGSLDCQEAALGQTPDFGLIIVDESYIALLNGRCTVSHHSFYPEQVLGLAPGEHSVYFCYNQNGDGQYTGEDLLAISELSLDFEPLPELSAELWDGRDMIDFGSLYAVQTSIQSVNIANTGKSGIQLTGFTDSKHFKVVAPDDTELYSLAMSPLSICFDPAQEDGIFEEEIQVSTTAGTIKIKCTGTAMPMDNVLLLEDFDGDISEWTFFDKDNDSANQWRAINSGTASNPYAHSGPGCLVSCSFNDSFILPDNYAVSPEFTIPEDGAELTYWVAASDKEYFAEIYDVIIGSGDDMATYETVFSEQLDSRNYRMNTIDLSEFKGRTVSVIFRHHSDSYEDYLLLDDVLVKTKSQEGISDTRNEGEVKSVEYYNLNGFKVEKPGRGIWVKRTVYSDGTSINEKTIVK